MRGWHPEGARGQPCGRNMKFFQCGSFCERTCRDVLDRRPPPTACPGCAPAGCYCSPGYVRFFKSLNCVRESQCVLPKKK
uniref:TIL domain-containing protein n=1 Tax=Romanomermis culicivorax TaxID=13658 RepID=A0A915KUP7_ROMCU